MPKGQKRSLADPTTLQPFSKDDKNIIQVVIETPKGSRNKFAFDTRLRLFTLSKVLPDGMVFPHDFGFVPETKADDGDPIDVLLLMDEPAYPGVVVESRLVGVIEGEQKESDGSKERNDRLVAVAKESHTHSNIKTISDLNKRLLKELEDFFVNYHELSGSSYKVLECRGPGHALKLLQKSIANHRKKP